MYWMESEGKIRELVDMYPLTVDGLKHGIKKLMSDKNKNLNRYKIGILEGKFAL